MTAKVLAKNMNMPDHELVQIFFDESKRICMDEQEAILLTKEAVQIFLRPTSKMVASYRGAVKRTPSNAC